MERESFIFYRSFYEAIKCMPADVRAEIYPAICEYALFGKEPKGLSEVARGIFMLIKPNIDVNTARFENGKKGAQYGARGGRPRKTLKDPEATYSLSFEQEVEKMKSDHDWRAIICRDYHISAEEYDRRLSRFLNHCKDIRERKGKNQHESFADCQDHLRYWMSKAFKNAPQTPTPSGSLGRWLEQIDKRTAQRQERSADYLSGEALAEKLKGFRLSAPEPILPDNIRNVKP